ncbi:MAG: acetate kinase [Parachlamydiales bacterium]|nr:acetate kinase [Parachlamydiales bacterium]
MKILVLNCGSSSLKSSLYDLKNHEKKPPAPIWEGQLQWTGRFSDVALDTKTNQGQKLTKKINAATFDAALSELIASLMQKESPVLASIDEIDAVGHRIVHGGKVYRDSVLIDHDVKSKIRQFAAFAPLHNFPALQGIEAMEKLIRKKPQIAVFDTAFHHSLPMEATVYPVPYHWYEQGVQRFGFHGISYHYCSERAADMLQRDVKTLKMVICHLGAGASLCAVMNGKSHDTTMGFTPLEGLMMNTRSGTIDPGIILERLKKTDLDTLSHELYRESGLWGVSGVSSDMREILKSAHEGHQRAQLAFDMYIHRLSSCIGSMVASIAGIDALVYTAGIGENTPVLRKKVCERFAFLGIDIDPDLNDQTKARDADISSKNAKVRTLVIHTEEAFEIARECWRMVKRA